MLKTITAQSLSYYPALGMIISKFNSEITELLYQNALEHLKALKILQQDNITAVWVPGAIEIPVAAQSLAESRKFDAIICLGAVIRGETSHYDTVCQQVSYGCQHVSLSCKIPVIFGVLTTEDESQALARIHKGSEAVDAALEMVSLLRQIKEEK